IHIVDGSRRVVVSANTAYNTGDDAFAAVSYQGLEQTQGITFTSNISHESKARGITCVGAKDCIISSNQIYNSGCHGIYTAFETSFRTLVPSNVLITGNLVVNAPKSNPNCQAVLAVNANDVTISDNQITGGGDLFTGTSRQVQILNNYLHGRNGLVVDRASTDIVVRGNKLNFTKKGIILNGVQFGEISSNNLKDTLQAGNPGDAHVGIYNSKYVVGKDNLIQSSTSSRLP